MKLRHRHLLTTCTTALLLAAAQMASATTMKVSTDAFAEGGKVNVSAADTSAECGTGKRHNPEVSWSDLPAGTQSMAVLILDVDGHNGLGVSHWVTYNIPAQRGGIKEGEALVSVPGITVGKNIAGTADFRGFCPAPGDQPHHYVLTVIATDLKPGALPEGLTREELMTRLGGHALAGRNVVGLYGH
ncbi:YbhB/YbcL family Raf kinase inhibitor-like protein [Pseudomonas putida]